MHGYKFVSEIARSIGCRPREISDLFYARLLPDEKCPIVSGRRFIPAALLPQIRRLLSERAKRRKEDAAC